jgi:hypothetical protein
MSATRRKRAQPQSNKAKKSQAWFAEQKARKHRLKEILLMCADAWPMELRGILDDARHLTSQQKVDLWCKLSNGGFLPVIIFSSAASMYRFLESVSGGPYLCITVTPEKHLDEIYWSFYETFELIRKKFQKVFRGC